MKGTHKVSIYTKRLRFDFELKRNITIIRGDSATGKTTLVDMVQEYINNEQGSPVELICDKKCRVLTGSLWREQLSAIHDSIVFIDEGNAFVKTDEFARTIQETDNYYVIITRESLTALPYSVEEIYGIRLSGKYGTLKQSYHEFYRIYGANDGKSMISPETVITEDSNSGYQFFKSVSDEAGIKCISAKGKSNVFRCLKSMGDEPVLIIADGAAFGAEIDKVMHLIKLYGHAALYLPESFEWLILSSGILKNQKISQMLENPPEFVESKDYFSWERFFTVVLTEETKDTYLAYSKKKLNESYLNEKVKTAILAKMEGISFS